MSFLKKINVVFMLYCLYLEFLRIYDILYLCRIIPMLYYVFGLRSISHVWICAVKRNEYF